MRHSSLIDRRSDEGAGPATADRRRVGEQGIVDCMAYRWPVGDILSLVLGMPVQRLGSRGVRWRWGCSKGLSADVGGVRVVTGGEPGAGGGEVAGDLTGDAFGVGVPGGSRAVGVGDDLAGDQYDLEEESRSVIAAARVLGNVLMSLRITCGYSVRRPTGRTMSLLGDERVRHGREAQSEEGQRGRGPAAGGRLGFGEGAAVVEDLAAGAARRRGWRAGRAGRRS